MAGPWWEAHDGLVLTDVEPLQLEVIILVAALTELRQSELLGLRWRDVDWKAQRIRVRNPGGMAVHAVEGALPAAGSIVRRRACGGAMDYDAYLKYREGPKATPAATACDCIVRDEHRSEPDRV